MSGFREIALKDMTCNPFTMMNDEWMLLTAGNERKCNTMTVSWGALGVLWGKPAATVYVRPSRYTLEFLDREETFSLCVLGEGHREALNYCGSRSGRDGDKIKAAGLTPLFEDGTPYFQEAKTVLVCRKLYKQEFDPACFTDPALDTANYPKKDYHRMFVGEIRKVLVKG